MNKSLSDKCFYVTEEFPTNGCLIFRKRNRYKRLLLDLREFVNNKNTDMTHTLGWEKDFVKSYFKV